MLVLRSLGAIVAGFLTVVLFSVATDTILERTGIFPSASAGAYGTSLLALALLYRTIYTILGGFITAYLAPQKPMRLVSILGILGTLAGIGGAVAGWNLSAHWYPIALALFAFP